MLTSEQEEVVKTSKRLETGDILLVNACAGSGKTTTCLEVAKANPNKSILYLVFNKNMQLSVSAKFPKNTVVKTIHSLAYQYIISHNKKQLRNRDYNFYEIKEILVKYGLAKGFNPDSYAYRIGLALNDYFNSNALQLKAFLKRNGVEPKTTELAIEFFKLIQEGEIESTHSSYLKEFQLLCHKFPELLSDEFDMIILDEAQDTNPVTWAILEELSTPKICVGDTHQSIYGFRGATNIMEKIEATKRLTLTINFRSTQPILDRANYLLEVFLPDNFPRAPKMVTGVRGRDMTCQSTAIISRTNGEIISRLRDYMELELAGRGYFSCQLPRGVDVLFAYVVNYIHWLQDRKVISPEFKWLEKFKTKEQLEREYIEKLEDKETDELYGAMKLIDDLGIDTLRNVYKYAKMKSEEEPTKDTIYLVTAHSAKGLEYDKVIITSDYPLFKNFTSEDSNQKRRNGKLVDLKSYIEEINIYYVAITRAKKILEGAASKEQMFAVATRAKELLGGGSKQEENIRKGRAIKITHKKEK